MTAICYRIFGAALAFFLFCTYPIALIPHQLGGGDSYYLKLPALFVLTCLSLPVLITGLREIRRSYLIGLAVLALTVIANIVQAPAYWRETLVFLGYLTIPFATAIVARNFPFKLHRQGLVLAALWLLLVLYGFNLNNTTEVRGITGNRNWMAICLLATMPWAATVIYMLCYRLRKPAYRFLIAGTAMLPCFYLVYKCRSRAAWLALIAYAVFVALHRIPARIRIIVVVTTGVAIVALGAVNSDRVINDLKSDIRLPVWNSARKLINKHPALGVTPGRFSPEFADVLSTSSYHDRLVASERVEHPHNEFLNIAMRVGLPAALVWLICIGVLLQWRPREPFIYTLAHCSAFLVYFHSFLDKPLIQPPSSIIALCCLGVFYSRFLFAAGECGPGTPAAVQPLPEPGATTRRCAVVLLVVAVVASAMHIHSEIKIGWIARGAGHYDRAGHKEKALACYDALTRQAPRQPSGWYGAGATCLEDYLDPERALMYLEQLHALDPNYAHLNRLLAKAYDAVGQPEKSVQFFARDCELYPKDPKAFQFYFMALEINERFNELPAIDAHLRRLYVEKSELLWSRTNRQSTAENWLAAVVADDSEASRSWAEGFFNERLNKVPYDFGDPLIYSYSVEPWPRIHLNSSYDEFDHHYWHFMAVASLIYANDIPSSIVEAVRAVRVVPHSPFTMPAATLDNNNGSPLARAALLFALFDGAGLPAIIFETGDEVFVAVTRESTAPATTFEVYNTTTQNLPLEAATADSLKAQLAASSQGARLYYAPQSFALRNQILGVYLRRYLPDFPCRFDQIPVMKILETSRIFAHVTRFELEDCCLSEPFPIVHRQLIGRDLNR